MFRLAPLHRAFSRAGLTERPLPDTRPDLGRCSKGFALRDGWRLLGQTDLASRGRAVMSFLRRLRRTWVWKLGRVSMASRNPRAPWGTRT